MGVLSEKSVLKEERIGLYSLLLFSDPVLQIVINIFTLLVYFMYTIEKYNLITKNAVF